MNEITAQRAREFGIDPQRKGESDYQFRERVSGELRAMGHIIEAHEAYQNALYDQSDNAMQGIIGAVAQQFYEHEYSPHDPVRQVGDDIAVGGLVQHRQDDDDGKLALLSILLGL